MLKKTGILTLALATALSACSQSEESEIQNNAENITFSTIDGPDGPSYLASTNGNDSADSNAEPETPTKPSNPDVKVLEEPVTIAFCVDYTGNTVYPAKEVVRANITPNVSTFTVNLPETKKEKAEEADNSSADSYEDSDDKTVKETVKGAICTSIARYYAESDKPKIDAYRATSKYTVNFTDGSRVILLKDTFDAISTDDETNTVSAELTNDEGATLEFVVSAAPGAIATLNSKYEPQ